jgi:hypothetical protein
MVSTGLYSFLKILKYDEVNGSQDRDDTLEAKQRNVYVMPPNTQNGNKGTMTCNAEALEPHNEVGMTNV